MSIRRLTLSTGLYLFLFSLALALPAPYTAEELEEASDLIVEANVTDVVCLGPPVVEEGAGYVATISSYRSTLTVSAVIKGTPPEVLTIDGTSTSYEGQPPIGGWTTPAYGVGNIGTYHLVWNGESTSLTWWNGFTFLIGGGEPEDLPDCAGACTPNCTLPGGLPRECGDDGCGGDCGTCNEEESCEAGECVSTCVPQCTKEEDGQTILLNCGDDGCGGNCGTCSTPSFCEMGQCTEPPCDPASVPGETMCGSNGCGGTWGDCPDGQTCGPEGFCVDDTTPADVTEPDVTEADVTEADTNAPDASTAEPGEPTNNGGGGCASQGGPGGPTNLGFALLLFLVAFGIRTRRISPGR